MIDMRFLDTNVLLYSISRDATEEAKRQIAISLLGQRDLALSVQVLQEFYVQATRQTRADRLTHEQAAGLIGAWLRFRIQDITVSVMKAALATKARYCLSYWDAAILEAARAAGCRDVFSEDLSHGQDYEGIHVINPFLTL